MITNLSRSTIVKPFATIQRERLLPVAGEVVVRIGQHVLPGQVVARARKSAGYHILPVSKMMRLPPEEVEEHLLVSPGTAVEQGTPLFRKPSLIRKKQIVSPVNGRVVRLYNGRLLIAAYDQWLEFHAWLQGQVVNDVERRGIVLQTEGALIQAVWGSGKNGYGPLHILDINDENSDPSNQLSGSQTGAIIVLDKLESPAVLALAEQIGVAGFITGSLSGELYQMIQQLSYPVIATDGFGSQGMAQPISNLLQDMAGQEATLFGHLPDKQGNRPEIIVPLPRSAAYIEEELNPNKQLQLAIGQRVRILRLAQSNHCGVVKHIYKRRHHSKLGFNLEGADVKLPDGSVVFVPFTNLDQL